MNISFLLQRGFKKRGAKTFQQMKMKKNEKNGILIRMHFCLSDMRGVLRGFGPLEGNVLGVSRGPEISPVGIKKMRALWNIIFDRERRSNRGTKNYSVGVLLVQVLQYSRSILLHRFVAKLSATF